MLKLADLGKLNAPVTTPLTDQFKQTACVSFILNLSKKGAKYALILIIHGILCHRYLYLLNCLGYPYLKMDMLFLSVNLFLLLDL